ncbi:MAG: hypothetical protein WA065_06625, partial [Trichococcus flocculiformis]
LVEAGAAQLGRAPDEQAAKEKTRIMNAGGQLAQAKLAERNRTGFSCFSPVSSDAAGGDA